MFVKVVIVIEGAVSMKTSVKISLKVSSEVVEEDLSLPVVELESFSLFLKYRGVKRKSQNEIEKPTLF